MNPYLTDYQYRRFELRRMMGYYSGRPYRWIAVVTAVLALI
jgi:hypothetical protein